jgi:hypothetical protein
LLFTSPHHAGALRATKLLSCRIVFYADIEDEENDEAEEVKEADDCGVDVGDV